MAIRVRRPKQRTELLNRLTEGDGRAFKHLYEALTFCAAFGYESGKQIPFDGTGEPIRWEQFQPGVDALADMLAVASTDNPEILATERLEERIRIFEEYANGGLEALEKELDRNPTRTPREVVLQLVLDRQQIEEPDLGIRRLAEDLSG